MRVLHYQGVITDAEVGETVYAIKWVEDVVVEAGFRTVTSETVRTHTELSFDSIGAEPPRQSHATDAAASPIGVIICTRNRPELLRKCLDSLYRQRLPAAKIVVVDNAPDDDRTRQVCAGTGVTYVREDRKGLSFARNTGIENLGTEYVAYTDDDVILHPNWLARLVEIFQQTGTDAIAGLTLPLSLETQSQQVFEQQWSFNRGLERKSFSKTDFENGRRFCFPAWEIGAGANMAFRRQIFEEYGLFEETLGAGAAGCSEDSEYWYRILGSGGTCLYDPSAIVFHSHRDDDAALQTQLRAYMRGHTVALRIQGKKFPKKGNAHRRFITLPLWYAKLTLDRIRHGRRANTWFLLDEIRGYLEGLVYPLPAGRGRLR